jgi:hypothetical protein
LPFRQVNSLKALGLNIRRAKLKSEKEHKFYVTDNKTSEKVGSWQHSALRSWQWQTFTHHREAHLLQAQVKARDACSLALLTTCSPAAAVADRAQRQAGGDPAGDPAEPAAVPP